MMNDVQEIRDDEIRVLGTKPDISTSSADKKQGCVWRFLKVLFIMLLIYIVVYLFIGHPWEWMFCRNVSYDSLIYRNFNSEKPLEDKDMTILYCVDSKDRVFKTKEGLSTGDVANFKKAYTEVVDTMINDVLLKIYIPHNAVMSLHRGQLNIEDTTIVYVTQAADIRADNGEIVGAFVINGEPLTRGVSKLGYCASVNGEIHIGMARNTDLFDRAVQTGGCFFRQYPLVHNGTLVENEPKGKSIRRSICKRRGQVFMVETLSRESFHDFAQALVDLGVDDAVYLVGSSTYGWAMDREGRKHEFGNEYPYVNGFVFPENINYIVWR